MQFYAWFYTSTYCKRSFLIFTVFFIMGFHTLRCNAQETTAHISIRGAWLTTLNNIDWPSKSGLSEAEIKQELFETLDFYESIGINTIFFQVRPEGDAFYRSAYEPWSEHITGNKGEVPPGNIDPLQLLLDEAHERYMEVHAWINPFRALFSPSKAELDDFMSHQANPEWFVKYGHHLYYDPGVPEVRNYTLQIITDIVTGYDVDGIHFDDYFYPYPIANKIFNDQSTFYTLGNGLSLSQWRKANIDDLVFKVHQYLSENHPYVKFGISPFGVWENGNVHPLGSDTKAGITALSSNYADIMAWMQKGWVDYIVPQIYWNIGFNAANFEVLTKWWNKYSYGRHIYVGHSLYKFDENSKIPQWRNGNEISKQFAEIETNENLLGSVFFNTTSLKKNVVHSTDNIQKYFRENPTKVAIMPYKKQLAATPIHSAKCKKSKEGILVLWDVKTMDHSNFGYGIYIGERGQDKKLIRVVGKSKNAIVLPSQLFKDDTKYEVHISSISKTHQEIFYKSTLKMRKRKGHMVCR